MQQNPPSSRFFQFFIVFGITFLVMSFLLPKPSVENKASGVYTIISSDSDVVIPNAPVVSIVNNTTTTKQLDICRDIELRLDGKVISDLNSGFCKPPKDLAPTESYALDFNALDKLFYSPAKLNIRLFASGAEVASHDIAIEEQGFFRSIVTHSFYAPILNVFVAIITALPTHSLGLAIILLTILVRLVLLVPQHKSMVSARRMQELQPKIKALQEEYKGKQQELGLKMMELWKREKVNPFGACLPLLIQLPFLSAIYFLLISVHDTANGYYLYSFFEGFSFPSIDKWFIGVDLLSIGGTIGIISAVILGIAQFAQIKLSLAKTTDTNAVKKTFMQSLQESAESGSMMPNQEVMSRFFLYFMPIVIGVSALFFPLGLTLYWFIGNLFMIAQQIVANRVASHKKKAKKISS